MAIGDAAQGLGMPAAVPVPVTAGAGGAAAGYTERAAAGYAGRAATRYLCAAAHLRPVMLPAGALHRIPVGRNAALAWGALPAGEARPLPVGRDYVRQVLRRKRLMGLAPGVDAELVHRHCRTARRQLWARDIFIALTALFSGLLPVTAAMVLISRWAPGFARRHIVPFAVALVLVSLAFGPLGAAAVLAPLAGAIICWAAFFTDSLLARLRLRRLGSAHRNGHLGRAAASPADGWLRSAARKAGQWRTYRTEHTPGPAVHEAGGEGAPASAMHDVVPYAKDRIVGAGVSYGARTITIAVDKPAGDREIRSFQAHDLLEHIAGSARDQARRLEPTHGIPQLDVSLVLAVPESAWAQRCPAAARALIYRCADDPQTGAPYRGLVRTQAVAWDGQLVVSVYVAAALEGRYLTVTALPHVLPPVVPELQIADGLGARHPLVHVGHAAADAARELRRLNERLRRVADVKAARESRRRAGRKEQRRQELFSFRESYALREPDDIVQRDDALRIINVIQTRIFTVTEKFLTGHGVDTAEFTRQVQFIMQNSVIVHGNVGGSVQNVHGDGAAASAGASSQQGATP